MANKTIEYIEPATSDVRRIIFNYLGDEVQSAIVESAVRNTTDTTTQTMRAHVDRDGMSAGDIADFESVLVKANTVVKGQNGF